MTADEWHDVPQGLGARGAAAQVSAGISARGPRGRCKLNVTIQRDLLAQLGWAESTPVGLALGTGRRRGWARLRPMDTGPQLRVLGRATTTRTVGLVLPPGWEKQERVAVKELEALDGILLIRLPWPPPGSKAELAALRGESVAPPPGLSR
ncbi:hypothetical protein [Roseococcus thiosulfatophilus]|uniref:hypothetical protein n=1 Tax=Roseococcus thiosulfatophilus TaxID=35813 RepID=UPI001A8FF0C4|nr:hypothetical protein [Roseococcus thiosulfatophilus]